MSFGEGVLGLGDVLSDLILGLEDSLGECFDCVEELDERRVT